MTSQTTTGDTPADNGPTLAKTFDPAAIEARWYAHWEDKGLFRPERPGAEPFTIVNPPPNVTGSLHIGHALDNTLQDVVVRYERLRGKDALWVVGTDHAGIATQMVVERNLASQGIKRTDMSRDAFVEHVWEWKAQSGGSITGQLRRLGCSMDWSREQFTMDPHFSRAVIKVFVDLYNQGLIYRDKRLVNWDPKLKTAISDLEVENREVPGHMWHFKYPLAGGETYTYVERDEDGAVLFEEQRDYIAIATTRPETMLGDGAVAVHPGDARYAPIVGKLCEIPVGPREHRRLIPIIVDEYPDPTFGSGAVKITGAHDENDYGVAQRNGIPMYRLMDEVAALRSDGEPYAVTAAMGLAIARGEATASPAEIDAMNLVPDEYRGLDRYAARKQVVADIDAEGLMIAVEDKLIMQPFGDRGGVVIEPMLTDQWYVNAQVLAQPPLEAVRDGRIEIVPKSWEKTFFNWMENIQPWCVSRQLWWGHRIPAWFAPDGTIHVAETEAEAQALAGEGVELEQDPDVLDTWFSSALWPFATLGWPDPGCGALHPPLPQRPADLRLRHPVLLGRADGDDGDEAAWGPGAVEAALPPRAGPRRRRAEDVEVQGQRGRSAAADRQVRRRCAALFHGGDGKPGPRHQDGREARRGLSQLRHQAVERRAVLPVQRNCCIAALAAPAAQSAVNRWIIGEVVETVAALDQAMADLRFDAAANAIYHFVWDTFCDWYIELIKGSFDDETRDGCRVGARPDPGDAPPVHAVRDRGTVERAGRAALRADRGEVAGAFGGGGCRGEARGRMAYRAVPASCAARRMNWASPWVPGWKPILLREPLG